MQPLRVLRGSLLCGMGLLPSVGLAQSSDPAPSPAAAMFPVSASLHLGRPFGEPTSPSGSLAPALAVLPLQLSLLGSAFPVASAVLADACASRTEASGNASWGFPMQMATSFTLAPQLTLHGFSRLGCPVDAGLGGALSYAMPLPHDWWLVGSGGFFGQPDLPSSSKLRADARLDLMTQRSTGGSFAVGVDAAERALTFTSRW
jgi:hypothetical protein